MAILRVRGHFCGDGELGTRQNLGGTAKIFSVTGTIFQIIWGNFAHMSSSCKK